MFIVLSAAAVAWQAREQAHRPIDASEMKIDAADLGSYAAEGSLLGPQRLHETVTKPYVDAHGEMWRDKIEKLAAKYRSHEPAAGLEKPYQDVRMLAERLLSLSVELSRSFSREGNADKPASELRQLASEAQDLKSRLAEM